VSARVAGYPLCHVEPSPDRTVSRAMTLGDFGDDLSEEAVVLSGAFEFEAVRALVLVALDDVECEASQQR